MASMMTWGLDLRKKELQYVHDLTEFVGIGPKEAGATICMCAYRYVLNVLGCMLEPATLPTQYYMAMKVFQ
nr:hypothetical protein [Tanacetum cinerariifolium]